MITQHYIRTARGNTLQVFYNSENNLLCVDLCNDVGGNEIVRKVLDEKQLLKHLKGVTLEMVEDE